MLGKVQELELKNLGNELFLFKFKSLEAGRKILEVGPWFVIGHPLVCNGGLMVGSFKGRKLNPFLSELSSLILGWPEDLRETLLE